MTNAFHSNWTKPFFAKSIEKKYYIEDFEILTTILSALKWREYNGNIKMITDEVGAEYYKYLGLEDIWDLGIEVNLDLIDEEINPSILWAAGKIFSLKSQYAPIAMIDTDFIVWKSIENILNKEEVSVIHKERINDWVYPNKDYFKFKNGYYFPVEWDWEEEPCNTAFTYIQNESFKEYYVNSSIEFMKSIETDEDKIKSMVFAEQRMISMCAKAKGIFINEIINLDRLSKNDQNYFTHIWGYKDIMRNDYNSRKDFCIRCIRRIIKDFPEQEDKIANIKELQEYYKLLFL